MKQQNTVMPQGIEVWLPVGNSTNFQPFSYYLKGLLVSTEVLKSNVISMHIYLSGQSDQMYWSLVLSNFHIALVSQSIALQYHIAGLGEAPVLQQEWRCYANLCRIADITDIPNSIFRLAEETDKLTDTYERMLPLSAGQADQSTSFFLVAEHLSVLNTYFATLQNWQKQDIK